MKNNSKGYITFKEGNIFVVVVLRTAEHSDNEEQVNRV